VQVIQDLLCNANETGASSVGTRKNLVQSPAGIQRALVGYLARADMRRLGLLYEAGFGQVAGSRCCCLRKPCQASSFVRVAGTEPLDDMCSWIRSSGPGLGSTGKRTSMEVCQILEQADARSGLTEGGSEGPWEPSSSHGRSAKGDLERSQREHQLETKSLHLRMLASLVGSLSRRPRVDCVDRWVVLCQALRAWD
jgi:hypothetical protein